jgi:hypothetical protein
MHTRPTNGTGPTRVVDDVFEVIAIVGRTRPNIRGVALTLCGQARCDALAGTAAASLVAWNRFRIRGCLMGDRYKPVLVVRSAEPVDQFEWEEQ